MSDWERIREFEPGWGPSPTDPPMVRKVDGRVEMRGTIIRLGGSTNDFTASLAEQGTLVGVMRGQ